MGFVFDIFLMSFVKGLCEKNFTILELEV